MLRLGHTRCNRIDMPSGSFLGDQIMDHSIKLCGFSNWKYNNNEPVDTNYSQTGNLSDAENSLSSEKEMWEHLSFFFLTPWTKFRLKRRIPAKMIIQAVKILFVTIQLVFFGFSNSAQVNFKERINIAFRNLYSRNWEASYETLPYPPSTGEYAIYTKDDFFQSIIYTLTRYNETTSISVGSFLFTSNKRSVNICVKKIEKTTSSDNNKSASPDVLIKRCANLSIMNILPSQLSSSENFQKLLSESNLTFVFERLIYLKITFELKSDPIYYHELGKTTKCFKHFISIKFDNIAHSGQIIVQLTSSSQNTACMPRDQAPSKVTLLSSWQLGNILIDVFTFFMSLLSSILCLRSIFIGFLTLKRARLFFLRTYSYTLKDVFWDFISPWYLLMLLGDFLIASGSIYKLLLENNNCEMYSLCCYLLGIGTFVVWLGLLRYIGFSYQNSVLLRTIKRSIPSILRYCFCAFFLYFAFVFCAWVILGPYNMKFRTFTSTIECLFSLINGDDMFATFSIIDETKGYGIYIFSRIFLYLFITFFIYVVLNIFITIIFEAYEDVKDKKNNCGRPLSNPLWHFVYQCSSNVFPISNQLYFQDNSQC